MGRDAHYGGTGMWCFLLIALTDLIVLLYYLSKWGTRDVSRPDDRVADPVPEDAGRRDPHP